MDSSQRTLIQRLREWISANWKNRTIKELAKEIGIPPRRFDKAMINQDDLADCHLQIISFLARNGERIASEHSHLPLVPARPAEFARCARINPILLPPRLRNPLFELQIALVRARLVYNKEVECAFTGSAVSGAQCLRLQTKPECFGCGAPSRLCSVCLLRPVSFTEVDICTACLIEEMAHEEKYAERGIPPALLIRSVQCLRNKNKNIPEPMCRSLQEGDAQACKTCEARSRLCMKCKSRRPYFPEWGLCLACTVKEYGPSDLPASVPLDEEEQELLARIRDPNRWDEGASAQKEMTVTPSQIEEKPPPSLPPEKEIAVPDPKMPAIAEVIPLFPKRMVCPQCNERLAASGAKRCTLCAQKKSQQKNPREVRRIMQFLSRNESPQTFEEFIVLTFTRYFFKSDLVSRIPVMEQMRAAMDIDTAVNVIDYLTNIEVLGPAKRTGGLDVLHEVLAREVSDVRTKVRAERALANIPAELSPEYYITALEELLRRAEKMGNVVYADALQWTIARLKKIEIKKFSS